MNGVIITVEKYPECVRFYRDAIGLPLQLEKEGLSRFRFGTMYLQIEEQRISGMAFTAGIILRQNVPDLAEVRRGLADKGIELEVHDLPWGEIGIVRDPHGNKLEYFREK